VSSCILDSTHAGTHDRGIKVFLFIKKCEGGSIADPELLGSISFWEALSVSALKSKEESGSASKSKFRSCGGLKWGHGGP
jgi:hypothetical protein